MVLVSSIFLDGLDFGLIIPCDIFAFCASSFKIGFFKGIIDISTANTFPIIIELNNSYFIKKNIFRGINLLNESLNYVISIYVQRIKCCFNNPV